MRRLTGRGLLVAAFAVPIAMVITPMTASADVPDDLAAYEDVSGSVASEDGAGIVDDSPFGDIEGAYATEEGAATFEADDEDSSENYSDDYSSDDEDLYDVHVVEDDDEDVDEVLVIEDDEEFTENSTEGYATLGNDSTVEAIESDDDEVYEASYDATFEAAEDDDDYGHNGYDGYESWDDDGMTVATYEDSSAYAGQGGAWINSTESGAMSSHDGFDSETAAWYSELTAAAGQGGSFVESTESSAMTSDDMDWSHGWHEDNESWAEFEHSTAGAGHGGAWVSETSSAAGELD
jgi:hypothetical protein